jgi:nucleoside-diphosphate-sugar epimerase
VADLADLQSIALLAQLSAAADAVVHLAAHSGVRSRVPDIERLRRRDIVTATDHVLAAVPADVQLVVASSSSVYGGARSVDGRLRPSREDDELAPRGGYARAKATMESRALQRRIGGGRLTVVRPFTVVGEGQRPDMALSVWITQALARQPLTVFGGLERQRDLTDVRGVVAALVALCLERVDGTFNLGSGRPRSLAEIVATVQRVVGSAVPTVVTQPSDDEVPATYADTNRLRDALGLELQCDLELLVERQLAWIRPVDAEFVA